MAGFIGYFGKYLSKIVIAKFSKKQKQELTQTIIHQHKSLEKYKAEIEKQKAKLEKKRLKALKKKNKEKKK